ncbi:nuclear transport factor 2 family protein [Bradyrhizobium sp. 200]|uniref:nuclear transport factor 2 family protein n=1 Tax=Bradyrhizobium sp. 200 TaxID=2782665 RepID=UPI001FFE617F|nr:nuclear transport factor 2 family protein [Bradyrhizobium sp. 200]UPJ50145.1 nuclear transport factor 2 family protein [Bradyrhizobium sp. 200]
MQTGISNDHAGLLEAWEDYRDGIYEGDVNKLDRIFHKSASMFYVAGGSLTVTPIADYFDIVRNRVAPQSANAKRDEKLISITIPSKDSATLTASILISGKSYVDQLVFMKAAETWLIVAKTYHLVADEGAEERL